jgi:hypothetical protein
MYQQGWTNDRLGLAAATAWTMFLIILVAVSINLLIARRREHGLMSAAAPTKALDAAALGGGAL